MAQTDDSDDDRRIETPDLGFEYAPERDEQLFGEVPDWDDNGRGTLRFDCYTHSPGDELTPSTLRDLVEQGYTDRDEGPGGGAPTIGDLLDFAQWIDECHPCAYLRFGGYAVDPERNDTRVTVDAVRLTADDVGVPYEALMEARDRLGFERSEFGNNYHWFFD